MSESINDGDMHRAVQAVIPQIPDLATGGRFGLWRSELSRNPQVIRDTLLGNLADNGSPVKDPRTPENSFALAKGETYAILGSTILNMHPHLVEGTGPDTRFQTNLTEKIRPQTSLAGALSGVFLAGYDQLYASSKRWVSPVAGRFRTVSDEYLLRKAGDFSIFESPELRQNVDGGGLAETVTELTGLAAVQQEKSGISLNVGPTEEDLTDFLNTRKHIMEKLAYLGLSKAGLNIGVFSAPRARGLHRLEGELQTVTRPNGEEVSIFKRESQENWKQCFPSADNRKEGPTIKCPAHQTGTETGKTPLSDLIYAGINLAHDKGFTLLPIDRAAFQISNQEYL